MRTTPLSVTPEQIADQWQVEAFHAKARCRAAVVRLMIQANRHRSSVKPCPHPTQPASAQPPAKPESLEPVQLDAMLLGLESHAAQVRRSANGRQADA